MATPSQSLPLLLLLLASAALLTGQVHSKVFTDGSNSYDCGASNANCVCPSRTTSGSYNCFNTMDPNAYRCPANGDFSNSNPSVDNSRGVGTNGRGTCPSGTSGDPLVQGFDGCAWYLKGQAGSVMNLITEADHVVNTLLVPANLTDEHHGGDGTFHGAISVRYQDVVVTSSVDTQGNLTVFFDGKQLPRDSIRERAGLTVKTAQHYPYYGQVAEVLTPAFRFFVHAVQPYDTPTGWSRGHLDLTAATLAAQPVMHGLLGQGQRTPGKVCAEDFNFSGEGKELDYVLPSLDSFEFAYNLFSEQKASRRLHSHDQSMYRTSIEPLVARTGMDILI